MTEPNQESSREGRLGNPHDSAFRRSPQKQEAESQRDAPEGRRLGNPHHRIPPVAAKGKDPDPNEGARDEQHLKDSCSGVPQPQRQEEITDLAAAEAERTGAREGDSRIGVPTYRSSSVRELSDEEVAADRGAEEEREQMEADRLFRELEKDGVWPIPRSLRRVVGWSLITVAGMLGLFLTSQTVVFVNEVQGLPSPWRALAVISLVAFGGIILFVLSMLLVQAGRLGRSPGINAKAIEALAARGRMQRFARERQLEAKKLLREYLDAFPNTASRQRELREVGMESRIWEKLQAGRDRLLDPSQYASPEDWIENFEEYFQKHLDEVARRRVNAHRLRIGLSTAVSPSPFIDRMVFLYSALSIIRDLCLIYNLRPARGQSLTLLAKSILMTYLSGLIQTGTEAAADLTPSSVSEALGAGAVGVLQKGGAKVAEGGLNALLISRLGHNVMKMLKPVSK